ncbi:MAG: hypothetical protein CUR34_00915 [Sediminibacterium sp.]|nr:MAG: hypothetical protein CUR34_00915 [Sediminibacterium sp.] [Sediminibacterium sp. FEMGT703S]
MNSYKSKKDSTYHSIVMSITLSRLIVAIPIFWTPKSTLLLLITIWIGLSDFLDGYLARKWQVTSSTGEKIDQYIDKIVTTILLLFYFMENQLSLLFLVLIIVREIAILVLRALNMLGGSSNILGKSKTFLLYSLFILLASIQYLPSYIMHFKLILEYIIVVLSYSSLLLAFKK